VTPKTVRQCIWLRKYGLKPWEYDQLPLQMAVWLDAVDYTLTAIEHGKG